MKTFVCLDEETTGLMNPDLSDILLQPHMTEIYALKFDEKFNVIDEIEFLVKPPIPIPDFITRITGIDDEMVKNAPDFFEICGDLGDFFTGVDAAVGHNLNFDLDILKIELRRLGFEHYFPWPRERICTIELSFPINNKRMKLGQLYNLATGKVHEGAHRAREDVIATVECFKWLMEQGF